MDLDLIEQHLKDQRNTRLKHRREALKAAGIPPMLAKQAAYWSPQRIKDELGVEIDDLPY